MHAIVKQTSGTSVVWRVATGETSKVMANGSVEVSALSLKSGAAAATCFLYDAKTVADANASTLKWALDSANTGNDNQDFSTPLFFKNGLVAIFEQGSEASPLLCIERVGQ